MRFAIRLSVVLSLLAAVSMGCSWVDDDLSDCETEYTLDYELRLVTNMTAELQTQLSLDTDLAVSTALKDYLSNIFTDYAHDVDLGFYDVEEDSVLLYRESHIMDANQTSYTIFIPVRQYMHLAMANVSRNQELVFRGADYCHRAQLAQQETLDTIAPHRAGIFTARLPMDIKEGEDQQFDVSLYMANCASALVIDTLGSGIRDMKVYLGGFATGFNICDSLYRFNDIPPLVRPDRIEVKGSTSLCFAAAHFPSREPEVSKTIIDVDDSSTIPEGEDNLWKAWIYVSLPDGTITQNVLGFNSPIRSGHLKLLKGKVYTNGVVATEDPTVTVSIAIDWVPGLEIPVDL